MKYLARPPQGPVELLLRIVVMLIALILFAVLFVAVWLFQAVNVAGGKLITAGLKAIFRCRPRIKYLDRQQPLP